MEPPFEDRSDAMQAVCDMKVEKERKKKESHSYS